jgi:SAM-dependent methyltransferase
VPERAADVGHARALGDQHRGGHVAQIVAPHRPEPGCGERGLRTPADDVADTQEMEKQKPPFAATKLVRLEGFEPPTRGLEGRRSSTELQAPEHRVARLAAHLEFAALPDEDFVRHAYRLLVRRDPLPEDLQRCVDAFGRGALSRTTLLHEIASSAEFVRVRALDDAVALAREARLAGERPRELTAPPGTDERAVELTWTLSRYRQEPRVLDTGYAFAEPAYLVALVELGAQELVGADLAEIEVPGLRGVVADLRELPLADGAFDVAFCISTLEHVGLDNRVYGLAAERDASGQEQALHELARVLSAGGRLLLTVPCGDPADLGTFVQRDPAGWRKLFGAAGFEVFEEEVYELREQGWRSAPDFDSAGVRYGERGPGASAVLCAELRRGGLRGAVRRAARAVRGEG